MAPTPVFVPGKLHGQKSLAGCSPWAQTRLSTHTRTHTHTHTRQRNVICVLRLDPPVAGKRAIKGILGQLTKSTMIVNCVYGSGLHRELVRYSL